VNLLRTAYDSCWRARAPHPGRLRHEPALGPLDLDVRAFHELNARGELGFFAWLASLVFSRKSITSFSWSDPGPLVRFWASASCAAGTVSALASSRWWRQWRSTAS